MSDTDHHLSLEYNFIETKFFAISLAVLIVAYLIPSHFFIKALLLIGIIICAGKLFFHGTTYISVLLGGKKRAFFQASVAITVPLIYCWYLYTPTKEFNSSIYINYILNLQFLMTLGLIIYVSWISTSLLDREHPFRGFIISSSIIFAFSFAGNNGYYPSVDDFTDSMTFYQNREWAKAATDSNLYVAVYLTEVTISHLIMYIKMSHSRQNSNRSS